MRIENNSKIKDGTAPSDSDAPTDLQEKNVRLLQNNAAIDGVLLVIEAAISSIGSTTQVAQFNSAKGLKTETVLNLILGFHGALVSTIYTESAFKLATSILEICSTKKILAFSSSDKEKLEEQKTFLKTIIKVVIETKISETQASITASGATVETTEVEKFSFPVAVETEVTVTLTKIEILLVTIKSLMANLEALTLSLTAIETAKSSTSSTGAEEETVVEVVTALDALATAQYGEDLSDTAIISLAAQLVKITIVKACKELSEEKKVILFHVFSAKFLFFFQTTLTKISLNIQIAIISITKQIQIVQNSLTLLTGVTLNLATLDIQTISSTTGVISLTASTVTDTTPSTEAEKVPVKLSISFLNCFIKGICCN